MAKVLGLGGLFFKSANAEATRAWYARVLGVEPTEWGGTWFPATDFAAHAGAGTVFNVMSSGEYIAPSANEFMFNLVVDDLDAILARAKEHGVEPIKLFPEEVNGRFAHILDQKAARSNSGSPSPCPPNDGAPRSIKRSRKTCEGHAMLRIILTYGLIAGLIVAIPMFSLLAADGAHESWSSSHFFGYAMMIIALSMIFIGVKSYRDKVKGGVIKFLPAFLLGLGISVVAGVVYVIGWEITLYLTNYTFAADYAASTIAAAEAKGMPPAEVEALRAQYAEFERLYANPFMRLPMTFIEIFPVGVIISLITAAVLRNPRFLPARA